MKKIKLLYILDDATTRLTLWTLRDATLKDDDFEHVNEIDKADLIIISKYYWITDILDDVDKRKLIFIPYGASLKSPPILPYMKIRSRKYERDYSKIMWRLFCPAENWLKVMKLMGIDTSHSVYLGYPKMDLINYHYDMTLKSFGLQNKKTIYYAPTLGYEYNKCYSSYFDYLEFLVYLSLKYDFNLIIRPHPNLLRLTFSVDHQKKLNNIGKLGNVYIDYSWNPYPLFKLSDIIVGDVSSMTYESIISRKPVVLIRVKDEDFHQFRDYEKIMDTVNSRPELEFTIKRLLNGHDHSKFERENFINNLPNNSTLLIKDYIKKEYWNEQKGSDNNGRK